MAEAMLPTRGTYWVSVGPGSDRVDATLAGFFTLDQVAAYVALAEDAIHETVRRFGSYRMIIDIRDCTAQSQDVVAAFAAHVAAVPRSRRLAIVVRSVLTQRQIRRIIGRSEVALFETVAQAIAWIDDSAHDRAA